MVIQKSKELKEKLTKLIPLPELDREFVIAGGCVANIIWNHMTGENAPIRDIDVYLKASKKEIEEWKETREEIQSYDDVPHVIKREEAAPFDFVTVISENDLPKDVISRFDLNCVMAAWDGETIYTRPEFETFLLTRQIQVTRLAAIKTVLRALKKSRDLNAYFDIEAHRFAVQWLRAIDDLHLHVDKNTPEKYSQEMSDLISLILEPVSFLDENINLFGTWVENGKERDTFFGRMFFRKKWKLFHNWWGMNHHNKRIFDQAIQFSFLQYSILEWEDPINYLRDAQISRFAAVNKFFIDHFIEFSACAKMPFQKQSDFMLLAKQQEKEHGEWVLPLIGGAIDPETQEVNEAKLQKLIEDYKKENFSPIITPIDPPFTSKSCDIKELVSVQALKEEGRELRHCVGGYGRFLKGGNYRIFSIRKKNGSRTDFSTLLLFFDQYHNQYRIAQHRTFGNAIPGGINRKVALEIVRRLNERAVNEN